MKRTRPEQAIQRAVFEHLRARGAPGVFAFHPANGGYRKPVEAAILKGLGVKPGVPDVIAIHNGRCFALELKAEGERATDKQLETIAALREAGAFTAIAEGLDRAGRAQGVGAVAGACVMIPNTNCAARELREAWCAVANAKLTEFRRQCWRLSMLVRRGTVDKQAAVDRLWEIAIAHALVRALGEDRIQAILDESFADADFRPMASEVA